MPLAVVSSSSIAWTITRSPRGLSFIERTSVRSAYPKPWHSERRSAVAWHSSNQSAKASSAFPLIERSSGLVLARAAEPAPLRDLGGPVRDLRETDDGDGVLPRDLPAVDLLEEVDRLVETAELRVVVLDVTRRELADPLDLHAVDDRLEDALARRVLEADRDQHDLALAVLLFLVAQADRRRLAAALELVHEQGRVEVQDEHGRAQPNVRRSAAIARRRPCPARPCRPADSAPPRAESTPRPPPRGRGRGR